MVNMHDVGRAAGVSQAAVSYAYNQPHKVSAVTRQHILDVAARLGYAGPDPSGRSLRTGRVGAFGLLLTESLHYAFDDPATTQLLKGISEVGELAEVALTLLPLIEPSRFTAGSGVLVTGPVDGFLAYAIPDRHPSLDIVASRGLPIVIIDGSNPTDLSHVGIDDAAAAGVAVEHVLQLGHRKVGILIDRLVPDGRRGRVGPARIKIATDHVMKERLVGYSAGFERCGVPWRNARVIEAGGFDYKTSRAAAHAMLDHGDITAVVAASDVLALATIDELHARGLQVPHDVTVVGFDDIPAAAQRGLTTIRQPLVDKGREAARLLLDMIEGREGRSVTLPTELVLRSTSASLA